MDKYEVFSRVNLNTPRLAPMRSFLRHNPRWPKRDKGENVGSLLCCSVGIVQCVFNLLYYLIWSQTPRNYQLVSIRSHGPKKPWTPYEVYKTNYLIAYIVCRR